MIDGTVDFVASGGTSDSQQKAELKEPVGVSSFLPSAAASALVRAAESAKCFEPNSVERQLVLDRVIKKVRQEFPQFFADSYHGSQRRRQSDR